MSTRHMYVKSRILIGVFLISSVPCGLAEVGFKDKLRDFSHNESNRIFAPMDFPNVSASYLGTHKDERVGYVLSEGGDVNGDGYSDFVIGNFHTDPTATAKGGSQKNTGGVYLILGKPGGWQHGVSLKNADARFLGKHAYYSCGWSVSIGGDVNGDGLDDILIGAAPGDEEQVPDNPGHAYLVFGKTSVNWGIDFVLADAADASFDGENGLDRAGVSVDIIGDMNGDGYDEFIIGACNYGENDSYKGKIYLFKGKSSGWKRGISVTEADAIFYSIYRDGFAGTSAKGVGDVNGDGIPDFAIGAKGISKVYLMFGRSSMDWGKYYDLRNADVIFNGENSKDLTGWWVSTGGNVNGDQYDDFFIGAPENDYSKTDAGKVYIIFGKKASNWSHSISLTYADASFVGEKGDDQIGWCVSAVKDLNHDGNDEILIGARNNDQGGYNSGKVYLIMGKASNWSRNAQLTNVDSYLLGENVEDYFGAAVSSAGDINGDGTDDIVISAHHNDEGPTDSGKIYLYISESTFEIISGSVKYYSNGEFIDNVTLSVTGDTNQNIATNAQGQYFLNIDKGSSFTVKPAKPADSDVGGSTISVYDAALVARNAIGLETLDSFQQIAADVDSDDNLTMFDAALICRYSVSLPRISSSHVGEWLFIPESMVYQNVNSYFIDQDYKGLIFGNVNGEWSGSLGKPQKIQNKNLLRDIESSSGQEIRIAIPVEKNKKMISAKIHFCYDSDVLRLIEITKTDLTKNFTLMHNDNGNGYIKIGLFGVEPLNKSGEILNLFFEVISNSKEKSTIVLDEYQINNGTVYNSTAQLTVTNKVNNNYYLQQNYPNPFNPETVISFHLPKSQKVKIVIFDIMGQEIRRLIDEEYVAGDHEVRWDGKNSDGHVVCSGIYFYKATFNEKNVRIRKMIRVE